MAKFTNKWKRSEEIIYINCHNQNSKHRYSFRLEICHKMWIEVWQVFSGLIKVRTVFITNSFLVFCPQCIVLNVVFKSRNKQLHLVPKTLPHLRNRFLSSVPVSPSKGGPFWKMRNINPTRVESFPVSITDSIAGRQRCKTRNPSINFIRPKAYSLTYLLI